MDDNDNNISHATLGIDNARAQTGLVRELAAIRRRRNLDVFEVAFEMGVPAEKVAHFERGGLNFTMSFLRSYARVVGATLQLHAAASVADDMRDMN